MKVSGDSEATDSTDAGDDSAVVEKAAWHARWSAGAAACVLLLHAMAAAAVSAWCGTAAHRVMARAPPPTVTVRNTVATRRACIIIACGSARGDWCKCAGHRQRQATSERQAGRSAASARTNVHEAK